MSADDKSVHPTSELSRRLHDGREDGTRGEPAIFATFVRGGDVSRQLGAIAPTPDHDQPFLPVLDHHRRQIDGKDAGAVGLPPMPSMGSFLPREAPPRPVPASRGHKCTCPFRDLPQLVS